jgi:hypothetical protein
MGKRMLQTSCILLVLAFIPCGAAVVTALAAGPSFDCSKVEKNSIEEQICKDDELSVLDLKMAEVYAATVKKAVWGKDFSVIVRLNFLKVQSYEPPTLDVRLNYG